MLHLATPVDGLGLGPRLHAERWSALHDYGEGYCAPTHNFTSRATLNLASEILVRVCCDLPDPQGRGEILTPEPDGRSGTARAWTPHLVAQGEFGFFRQFLCCVR